MNWQNIRRILKSDYLKLLLIMALAFYLAFIPHQNYPYPVHLDEWIHWASSNEIIEEASTVGLNNPFTGEEAMPSQLLEAGFHLFWAIFHQVSGISWLTIFRYFPGIIFIITVLSVYVLGRRQGFGWEAALFTALIPTTVGILGPAFLVPVSMGLLFIPLAIFIAFNFRTGWSHVVLFIFTSFLVFMHLPTATLLVITLIPYILMNVKGAFRHSAGMALAMAVPFLGLFPWVSRELLPMAKSLLTAQYYVPIWVEIPRLILTYGYFPILLGLLGTFILAIRGGKKNYGLVLGLLALLVMLATFFTFHYGHHFLYLRGLMVMMLMMSIVAGAGLAWVKNLRLPARVSSRLNAPSIMRNASYMLCLILVGLTLYVVIPARQHTPYYHMIETEDYRAFVWIKNNIDESYEKAILDPWKGVAFTALTGKYAYARIYGMPSPNSEEARSFLQAGSTDTTFLRENEISIVYTQGKVNNPDLLKVRDNIYILRETRPSE